MYIVNSSGPNGLPRVIPSDQRDISVNIYCKILLQYLKNGCTQYFTSAQSEKKINASQKSKQQQAKGGLRDPILDDVEDFQRLHQVIMALFMCKKFGCNHNIY